MFPCIHYQAQKKQPHKGTHDDEWRITETLVCQPSFFDIKSLFSSSNPHRQTIDEAIAFLDHMSYFWYNVVLNISFTTSDVRKATFELHPSKALGPDGFTGFFFQNTWSFLGDNIVDTNLNILNHKGDMAGWNGSSLKLLC